LGLPLESQKMGMRGNAWRSRPFCSG